jgi:CTP synthase
MRLGLQKILITEGSKAHSLYGNTVADERHRHRYEVNPTYIKDLEGVGWKFSGRSEDGKRMEIGELEGHPYFVASQFHPEFKTRPSKPTPMHLGLVRAAIEFKHRQG